MLTVDWSACQGNLGEPLGFYMMFTEIGPELTEKNAEDFYIRCKIIDKLIGHLYWIESAPLIVTPEIIKEHVGLKANVSPVPFTKWAMRQISNFKADRVSEWKRN